MIHAPLNEKPLIYDDVEGGIVLMMPGLNFWRMPPEIADKFAAELTECAQKARETAKESNAPTQQ